MEDYRNPAEDNSSHKDKGISVFQDFFYIELSTIRKNTKIVQETFEDLYRHISTN